MSLLTLICLLSFPIPVQCITMVTPFLASIGTKVSSMIIATKVYALTCCIVAKPFIIAGVIKSVWLTGVSIMEWSAGYMYASNCIGSGLSGWWSHIWSIGSPACISLLTTHVSLMGVFLASVICTIGGWILWASKKVKEDPTSRTAIEEFKKWKEIKMK